MVALNFYYFFVSLHRTPISRIIKYYTNKCDCFVQVYFMMALFIIIINKVYGKSLCMSISIIL